MSGSATIARPERARSASADPTAHRAPGSVPGLMSGLVLMLVSGSVATVAFDIWGQVISPGLLQWANLAPVPLAVQTVDVLFGVNSRVAGHLMHLVLVGLIAYPAAWIYVFRPLQERLLPGIPWPASAAAFGFGLFLVAIGIVAGPLLAGNPWFLGFTGITWVALIGHTLYGVVCAATVRFLEAHGV